MDEMSFEIAFWIESYYLAECSKGVESLSQTFMSVAQIMEQVVVVINIEKFK